MVARFGRDDGATAVLIALLITFIVLPVAAVSVDLSNAYSNRRQMQNAADAASSAGAQVMVGAGASGNAIAAAAKSVAQTNGVDTSDAAYSCEVVHVAYAGGVASVTQATQCTSWSAGAGYNGVRVRTVRNIQAYFAPALGLLDHSSGTSGTRATAAATAAIQKVTNPLVGNAIFAMCAFSGTSGNGNGNNSMPALTPLLVPDPANSTQWILNDAAKGKRYVVWSNAGGNSNLSRCGLNSSSFDGRICGMANPYCSLPITLPGTLAIDTGAAVGPVLATMAGYANCQPSVFSGTHPAFTPCAMVLPVCHGSNGLQGNNSQLYCDAFGEFLVSPGIQDTTDLSCTFTTGSTATICGKFLGPPQINGGRPVSGDPGADDPYRIALVQ